MYEVGVDTELHNTWSRGGLDSKSHPQYAAALACVLALTAQLCALDLNFCLDRHFTSRPLCQDIVLPAASYAEESIAAIFADPHKHAHVLPEHMQAHILLCALEKNKGNLAKYRQHLLAGISTFFAASYHLLDTFTPSNTPTEAPDSLRALTPAQHGLVRRLFWLLFSCDRLFSIFAGDSTPYAINVRHVNIWLLHRQHQARHVHDVCLAGSGNSSSPPAVVNSPGPQSGAVSSFMEALVDVAATAGRCADYAAAARTHPAAQGELEAWLEQAKMVDVEISRLRALYCETSPLDGAACPRQKQMLSLTVLQVQRHMAVEMSTLLCMITSARTAWLDDWQISTARILLEHVLGAVVHLAPRSMAWLFFLRYIAEPSRALLSAFESGEESHLRDWQHSLVLAVRGRNLLCDIAAESGAGLAVQESNGLCEHLSRVLEEICSQARSGPHHDDVYAGAWRDLCAAKEAAQDTRRALDVDQIANALALFSQDSSSQQQLGASFGVDELNVFQRGPELSLDGQFPSASDIFFAHSSEKDEQGMLPSMSADDNAFSTTEMDVSSALGLLLSMPVPANQMSNV